LREVGRVNGLWPAIMFVNICGFDEIMQKWREKMTENNLRLSYAYAV